MRKPGAMWTSLESAQWLGVHRQTGWRWLRGRMAARGDQEIWLAQMSCNELGQINAAPDRLPSKLTCNPRWSVHNVGPHSKAESDLLRGKRQPGC